MKLNIKVPGVSGGLIEAEYSATEGVTKPIGVEY